MHGECRPHTGLPFLISAHHVFTLPFRRVGVFRYAEARSACAAARSAEEPAVSLQPACAVGGPCRLGKLALGVLTVWSSEDTPSEQVPVIKQRTVATSPVKGHS